MLIQPWVFSLRNLQLSRRPGNLFYLFTPVKGKPKKPTWCCKPWPSNMHAAWCLAACQPASPACRSTQTIGLVTSIVVLRFQRTPPRLCHSWKELFSFCSGNSCGMARALGDLTCSFSGLVTTIDEAQDWQWRRRYAVRCWLRMQPTINTMLSPKAYRCWKQAHRRRIEDTPLPYPTQTRLNACQLRVSMIYSVQQQIQCTTQPAADRGRPGLWRHLLAQSG